MKLYYVAMNIFGIVERSGESCLCVQEIGYSYNYGVFYCHINKNSKEEAVDFLRDYIVNFLIKDEGKFLKRKTERSIILLKEF